MTENNLVTLVNASFLFLLLVITIWIAKPYFANNITKKDIERQQIIDRIGIVILGIMFGIVSVIIWIVVNTEFNIIENNDISNWVTLIVEIGIGIVISMSILIYSRHHDNRIDIQNQNEKERREKQAREEMYRSLNQIKSATSKREGIRTKKIKENLEIELKKSRKKVSNLPYWA